jgi:transposase
METLRTIEVGMGQRLSVLETGRRRRFSEDFKLSVVAESYAPGAVVTHVAHRHGVRPGQIYHWRALARGDVGRAVTGAAPAFVPVMAGPYAVEPPAAPSPLVVVLGKGRRIEVLPGFDSATLSGVVTTLEGLR